jgi:hypothetical protein
LDHLTFLPIGNRTPIIEIAMVQERTQRLFFSNAPMVLLAGSGHAHADWLRCTSLGYNAALASSISVCFAKAAAFARLRRYDFSQSSYLTRCPIPTPLRKASDAVNHGPRSLANTLDQSRIQAYSRKRIDPRTSARRSRSATNRGFRQITAKNEEYSAAWTLKAATPYNFQGYEVWIKSISKSVAWSGIDSPFRNPRIS